MKYLKNGGLLLIKQFPSTFYAIYEMIEKAKEIKPLYMSSLKGFVFVLNIDENDSLFYTLNEEKSKLDKKVNSLILKLALTSKNEEFIIPSLNYQGYEQEKQTDKLNDVIDEVTTQQNIYLESIKNTGNPIVPGIADFSYFNTENSFIILDKLVEHCHNDESKKILQYLKMRLSEHPNFPNDNDGYKLSIISMENAVSYVQIADAFTGKFTLEERRYAAMKTIAQMIRLFLQFSIIHCDAHGGNILTSRNKLYKNNNHSSMDVKIIDFGRFINLRMDLIKSQYTNQLNKSLITYLKNLFIFKEPSSNLIYELLLNDYETYKDKNTNDEIKLEIKKKLIQKLKRIFYLILKLDHIYNATNFGVHLIQSSTIFRFLRIYDITNEGKQNITIQIYQTENIEFQENKYMEILDILYGLMKPNSKMDDLSSKKIDNFIRDKRFSEIDWRQNENSSYKRDVKPYVKTLIISDKQKRKRFGIFGGKTHRKSKRNKRNKKTKKR